MHLWRREAVRGLAFAAAGVGAGFVGREALEGVVVQRREACLNPLGDARDFLGGDDVAGAEIDADALLLLGTAQDVLSPVFPREAEGDDCSVAGSERLGG